MQKPAAAVDFETYYDSDFSLSKMSTWNYVFHHSFDAYLVAISGYDTHGNKLQFVGHPTEFDWSLLAGVDQLMHNASFDALVVKRLIQDGVIDKDIPFGETYDTADLVAYLRCSRALADASRELLGKEMDKAMRAKMKGKTADDAKRDGEWERLLKYGGGDADNTLELWEKFSDKWPEEERLISKLNREAGWRGIYINREEMRSGIVSLRKQLADAEAAIPWIDTHPIQSRRAVFEECRKEGIWAPASLAKNDPYCRKWYEEFKDKYPWVKASREYRSMNMLLQRLITIEESLREDGTMPYQLKYFGAGTGRFSGGSGGAGSFNVQNMPKEPMYGVDLRPMFLPRPGYKLLICDYAQIEARLILWLCGVKRVLDLIKEGYNLYEATASTVLGMSDTKGLKKRDPKMYAMAKAFTLGCGFGMGGPRFAVQAPALTMGEYNPTESEAISVVALYREKLPEVPRFWRSLHQGLEISALQGDASYEVELPSGRVLEYFNPRKNLAGDYVAEFAKGGRAKKLFGALIAENFAQATARDILAAGWLNFERSELAKTCQILFTCHDEFVVEVPEAEATPETMAEFERLVLTGCSDWAKGCPLGVESIYATHYLK